MLNKKELDAWTSNAAKKLQEDIDKQILEGIVNIPYVDPLEVDITDLMLEKRLKKLNDENNYIFNNIADIINLFENARADRLIKKFSCKSISPDKSNLNCYIEIEYMDKARELKSSIFEVTGESMKQIVKHDLKQYINDIGSK